MNNQQLDKKNKSRLKKNKSSSAINSLMDDLYLMLLKMISTAIDTNDHEMLSEFNINDDMRNQLSNELLSLGTEQQSQVIEKISRALFDFSLKPGAFSSNHQQHSISEQRKTFRSTIDRYAYDINYLLLRLVCKATYLYDIKWLEQVGIEFKNATQINNLSSPQQEQLVRDCSASNGLAINVSFQPQFLYIAHQQIHEKSVIDSFINKLLDNKVDISRDSLDEYCGILPNEFSLRKQALGITSKKGPKYQLSNEQALLVDADWVKDISYFINLYDDLSDEWKCMPDELMKYYVLHRKYGVPVGSIISHNRNLLNN